jgi:hypothetical protein
METINYTLEDDKECILVKIKKDTHELVKKLFKEIGTSGDTILYVSLQAKLDEIKESKNG